MQQRIIITDHVFSPFASNNLQTKFMSNVHHISITINRPPAEVYAYAVDPRNLPKWAAGLAQSSVEQAGDEWIVDAPFGRARVKFVERNPFGVLDHDVTLDSGETFHNPMRVLPHGASSEFVFTLFRQANMTDQQFAADKAAIERDLHTLKQLLESGATP